MVNVFNSMSKIIIFQKNCTTSGDIIQLIPYVCAFCIFELLLFYNHCNYDGNVTMIIFAMGTHQGDPLGGALFHFEALCSTTSLYPSCLFPSIVNDIHIIRALFIILFTYEHFQIELYAIGLYIQFHKCNMVVFWCAI
jgi:hypothetical protein